MQTPEDSKLILIKWTCKNRFYYDLGFYSEGKWQLSKGGALTLASSSIVSWIYCEDIQFPNYIIL